MPQANTPPTATQFFDRVCRVLHATIATDAEGDTLGLNDAANRAVDLLLDAAHRGHQVFAVGNGGSAAIAGHLELDLCNRAAIPARSFNHCPAITALANDHGYASAFEKLLLTHARPGDVLIAISSSGRSENIHRACAAIRERVGSVITLSGFGEDNGLRTLGDFNFYCPSRDYGEVEVAHESLAHYLADRCVAARQRTTRTPEPVVVAATAERVLAARS